MITEYRLCFIIGCKQYKNYTSYLSFYISNIKKYYPSAFIILVDNNSNYKEVYDSFKDMENIILLENTSDSKFEIGAYMYATEYIQSNNLIFDYYICTQDTFILVNKYDFSELDKNNLKCCSLSHFIYERSFGLHVNPLINLNLYEPSEKFMCCWCTSYICNHDVLLNIKNILKNIKLTLKQHSLESERYMGKILKMLNNNISYAINNGLEGYNYCCFNIDPMSNEAKETNNYFIKKIQSKTENTSDN
jgi:hypothetical protein